VRDGGAARFDCCAAHSVISRESGRAGSGIQAERAPIIAFGVAACSPRPVRERIEGEGHYTAVIDGRFERKTFLGARIQWVRSGVWAFNAANTLGKPVNFP